MLNYRKKKQSGFVLLMVLVALVVVGAAMAATSRQSLRLTLRAADEQDALQRRWGVFSCEKHVLAEAPLVFGSQEIEEQKRRSPSAVAKSMLSDGVVLGHQQLQIILQDESAKVNLNAIYHASGHAACERLIRDLIGPIEGCAVRLLPAVPSRKVIMMQEAASDLNDAQSAAENSENSENSESDEFEDSEETSNDRSPPAFRSWGQVFDLVKIGITAGDDRHLATLTHHLGIHGIGPLNVYRADDRAVLAVCGSIVSDGLARRLLDRFRRGKIRDLAMVLETTVTDARDRRSLQELLGKTSSAYSMWIEATSSKARQQRYVVRTFSDELTQTIETSFE